MSEIKLWLAAENERLEAELAQTKRNITHVEDCWADALNALGETEAELAEANAKIEVTDEDAIQILRGYWRDVAASFCDAEIKHVVELLEAFVARRKPDPTPELRERIEALRTTRTESFFLGWNDALDAVLVALGEPK